MQLQPAVFLDKDGTLIRDVPYNVDVDRIELYSDTGPALSRLQAAGFALVVVSNQSGVARGYFTEPALRGVETRLGELLAAFDVRIDAFYYCPHHRGGTVPEYTVACDCRKPEPGLLLRAAREHDLDLDASWMIGDTLHDVEAGHRAGCRSILVNRDDATDPAGEPLRTPLAAVKSLLAAVDVILNNYRPAGNRAGEAYPPS
jgi:D-glycero-D-manno-heptose 1,7-bisphosphate phosphatase